VAVLIHHAEVELGPGIALFSSLLPPVDGLGVILGNSQTLAVNSAEIDLGVGQPLFGCLAVPLHGLHTILINALAVFTQQAKIELGHGVAVNGRFMKMARRAVKIIVFEGVDAMHARIHGRDGGFC
jgi:hypothetical protein